MNKLKRALKRKRRLKPRGTVLIANVGHKQEYCLGETIIAPPNIGSTQTFITVGAFDTQAEAQACNKYINTKFCKAMLGLKKATQHNPPATWEFVPLQDFTTKSDIDWSKSLPEIDQQLYAKYGLNWKEVAFIEGNFKYREGT